MSGYIGTQPVPQSTQTRDSFTATSGQTSFATGGYQSGYIDLYLNGIKLAAADYTATNNSDVVLAVGAATGDILEVVAYTAFNTANVTGAVDFTVTGDLNVANMTTTGNVTFGDGNRAIFGADTDMQLFHNGSSGTIANSTGSLVVRTDAFRVLNASNSEQILHGDADGAVTAYFNNAAKLATTATGISVTGTVTAGGGKFLTERGTAAAPVYSFSDDTDTGMFNIGNADLGFSVGGTTRMTLDASGNVLVGKTASGYANAGHQLNGGNSYAAFTRDGGTPVLVNRKTNDGSLFEYMKDGTTVGSIGTGSGDLNINGPAGHSGIRFQASSILPRYNGADTDGTMDLGYNDGTDTHRWRNLYLSGGVYLGGTGVNNHLHDYEEGVFTVSLALGSGSAALSQDKLFYTKVGRCVTVSGIIRVNSVSGSPSGTLSFNVPFACHAPSTGEDNPRATVQTNIVENGNNNEVMMEGAEGSATMNLYKSASGSLGVAGNILKANTTLGINFSYFVST